MSTFYCKACGEHVESEVDAAEGHSFCPHCGLQLEDVYLQQGPTFFQDGAHSHLVGTIVREEDLGREGVDVHGSRDRSVERGKQWIRNFAHHLQIPEATVYIEQAARLYQLAMCNGFTRGRRVNQVAAACLYVVLRQDRRPYLLIDFCKLVSVNVFVLGSTYLRLTETLRLSTHPLQVCLVDPSLYIHRFASKLKLPHRETQTVVNTALHLIASMKRDWMQTGRRPAGVCGAGLFLACHIHGVKVSRRDIIKVVSVGESTILSRISELRNTSCGSMTLTDFQRHAKHCYEEQLQLEGCTTMEETAPLATALTSGSRCRHIVNNMAVELAFGMCQACFTSYIRASGGISMGAEDPPALKRNLRKELKNMKRNANDEALRLLTSAYPSSLHGQLMSVDNPSALAFPRSHLELQCQNMTVAASTFFSGAGVEESGKPRSEFEDLGKDPNTSFSPQIDADDGCMALIPLPGPSAGETGGREDKSNDHDSNSDSDFAIDDESENSDSDNEARARKKSKRKRGRPKKMKMLDPSLEAEFALAMLENRSMKQIVDLLRLSNADLPALDENEARHVLSSSNDPLAQAQAQRAAALASIEAARHEPRADDEMLLRVARFLEVQNGIEYDLVSEPVRRVITEDMQRRAAELEQQMAEPLEISITKKSGNKKTQISLGDGKETEEYALDINEEQMNCAVDDQGHVDPEMNRFSDLDDDELDQYLATPEEAEVKKRIWAAKSAAAAAQEAEAPKKKKQKRKPVIAFKRGATAQESVENMLISKNVRGLVDDDALRKFFESAEAIAKGEKQLPTTEHEEPTGVAQHIKESQEFMADRKSKLSDKHAAALEREQMKGSMLGSIFDLGSSGLQGSSRPGRRR